MKYYIITGASKGLGEKLVDQILDMGHIVVGVSRSGHMKHKAADRYIELRVDLSNEDALKSLVTRALGYVDQSTAEGVYLINNAGGLDPIGAVGSLDPDEIFKSLTLNIAAPMVLSNAFIKETQALTCEKRILTLSSGAAKRPLHGWHCYCVGKAGVDMMTRSIGLEQGEYGVRAIAFGPGVMDTDMQAQIRAQEVSDFKDVEMFRGLKSDGNLRKPEDVAAMLLKVLHDPNVESGLITDVKELEN